ncbi:MAG: SLATT domain-containing protein, partial [Anaerolineales bacterium]|nr:SLATT domain-containing protein [Anaerolineales bacterium]
MSQQPANENTIALQNAWQRYAEFDQSALAASKSHLTLRRAVIVLSVVATLLAILTQLYGDSDMVLGQALKVGLILVPIVSSVILAFANKLQQGERWLVFRTGAEEILKEIYFFRTVLQQQDERGQWLTERVAAIQRQVFEGVGGELVLKPYAGPIPPYYSADNPDSDPGFSELLAQGYILYRLDHQLDYHSNKIVGLQTTRTRLQAAIFIFGGLGTLLAAWPGGIFSIWVALTTALAASFTAWLELRRLDSTINNYSQLILELKIIRDHWLSLSPTQQNGDEFFKMVTATERVLWSQHNQYISEMRRAVAELKGKEDDLMIKALNTPASPVIDARLLEQAKKAMAVAAKILPKIGVSDDVISLAEAAVDNLVKVAGPQPHGTEEQSAVTTATPAESSQPASSGAVKPKKLKGLPHAFVVMPFGRKQGPDGRWIDFNAIYQDLIKPALIEADFEPFRADEESVSGDILTDMFQELLLADLVIADLSIDNANVFYELGVRHSVRKRGLVHIQSGRSYMPFDIFNVRTVPYHTDKMGRPDPEFIEKDRQAIAKISRETWASSQDRIHSPIFNLLDGLEEPNRKSLHTPLATGYWREHKEWEERVEIAKRQKRIGDVLLLTEEVSNPLIKEDVIAEAGRALRSLGRHELALQQYREGLKINSRNSEFRREEAFHLARLKRYDEAIVKLERLLQDEPANIEAISYLGRIYKEMWLNEWANIEDVQERQKKAFLTGYWLKRAIDTYLSGYSLDQNHFYSGGNALTLALLLDNLVQHFDSDIDPEWQATRQQIALLKGAVQFTLESQIQRDSSNFWAFIGLADLAVCTAEEPKAVTRAYQKALTLAGQNRFALKSTLTQLELFKSLNFRPEFVKAGLAVLQEEIKKLDTEQKVSEDKNRHIFLFSGHMIDRANRPEPRFPANMEKEARERIEKTLDKLQADENDMAIIPGAACGGDTLFIEACLNRNMRVEILLPFSEANFIKESVSFAGDEWITRFYNIRNHPNVSIQYQVDRLGPLPLGDNPYERNNRWALYAALIYGVERIRFIALWDGKGGDGPGGTGHMMEEVRRLGGITEHLDTTKFDYWRAKGKVG